VAAPASTVPTDGPEADGTLEWSATTLVLVRARASGVEGLGFSYTGPAAAPLVEELLAPAVVGRGAFSLPASWSAMTRAGHNVGRPGLRSTAIAAVDTALWDLKARLLEVPLVDSFGRRRDPTDSSNYRQLPLGVVIPRDAADVVATHAACRAHGAPIVNRGGGTSLAGQSCNTAVVIDMSKYLNRIVAIDPAERTARVHGASCSTTYARPWLRTASPSVRTRPPTTAARSAA
jgi:hypothetical protein